jgi:hypothetical protein
LNIFKSFFAGLLIAAAAPVLDAAVINFDTLTSDQMIASPYMDLNWTNFYVYDAAGNPDALPPSGYDFSVVSSPNVAFNGLAYNLENPPPWTISSDTIFNLNSAYLTSVWRDNLQLRVIGSVAGITTYNQLFTLSATEPTLSNDHLITFNYLGVDKVEFIPSGGRSIYSVDYGPYFAMDNLNVDVLPLLEVPEPGTWVTAALLLAAIAFSQRDRLSRPRRIGR